jgi:UDP-N-acetyl-D-glucosamine dehydrogenase
MSARSTTNDFNGVLQLIRQRQATIGIVGLGYVGLPLVRAFLEAGFKTIGLDIDVAKVELLRRGQSYIQNLAGPWLADALGGNRFVPTSNHAQLASCDAILVCVPTPLSASRDPDLRYVEQTARQIAAILRPGQLIILESTTYPGTTRDVLCPILAGGGLQLDRDYYVAYSPERQDPGNRQFSMAQIPKVVGALAPRSLELAVALYSQVVGRVVPVSSAEVAEACKILENTYRAVNIALVNELKLICQRLGINVWEVIDAAKTKPFGFQAFYPGPGLGGHCIPIDPYYLSWLARKLGMSAQFVELAGEVNGAMPGHVVEQTLLALNRRRKCANGSKILVLGISYKPDIDDPRESPAFVIIERLLALGADVTYHDPFFPALPAMRAHKLPAMRNVELTAEVLRRQDAVLIVTNHSSFDYAFIVQHAPLVIDTRNATRAVQDGREKIELA